MKIITKKVKAPQLSENVVPVDLSAETMTNRKTQLLAKMAVEGLDTVVIYADREHGANFEYFTGFIPRFEEALLVLHKDGKAYLLLGNENTKMVQFSRISAELIHVPFFSLPNQPMEDDAYIMDYLKAAGIKDGQNTALIGWKNFTSKAENNQALFDLPYFIVEAMKAIIAEPACLVNGAKILIDPEEGIRTVNNANEIAHYEYGATLAGIGMMETINKIELGKTELELAATLAQSGQPINVTTICATGTRFTNANLYPRNNPVQLGDTFSASVGYKGGLSSRAAYIADTREDLSSAVSEYEEQVAHPYFKALTTWLTEMRVGIKAGEIYQKIEEVLPKKKYAWTLNPGHFVADEEWLASPFHKDSSIAIKSGQLFQIDIIPKVQGFGGVGCEDGIAVADEQLRQEIEKHYPAVWARICRRRAYLKQVLNIHLADEILPLNDIVAYYRPYLLNQELAFSLI